MQKLVFLTFLSHFGDTATVNEFMGTLSRARLQISVSSSVACYSSVKVHYYKDMFDLCLISLQIAKIHFFSSVCMCVCVCVCVWVDIVPW